MLFSLHFAQVNGIQVKVTEEAVCDEVVYLFYGLPRNPVCRAQIQHCKEEREEVATYMEWK